MPEPFHQPAFVRELLKQVAQVVACLRAPAKGFGKLSGPGVIEVEQVEREIDCHNQIGGGAGDRCEHGVCVLASPVEFHIGGPVYQGAAESGNPAALFQSPTTEGHPTMVLLRGNDIEVEGECVSGSEAAAEHGPDPGLAGLAVEKRLFGRDFGARSQLEKLEHSLGPGHFIRAGVQFPDPETGTALRCSQQTGIPA